MVNMQKLHNRKGYTESLGFIDVVEFPRLKKSVHTTHTARMHTCTDTISLHLLTCMCVGNLIDIHFILYETSLL